ncbi:MAG: hypothetical protein K0Q57_1175 [Gammaproteobacteria bacterium]|jgi:hypothetical protein|nr:hypothetical protein [Gammaproteobacteria bacterium]
MLNLSDMESLDDSGRQYEISLFAGHKNVRNESIYHDQTLAKEVEGLAEWEEKPSYIKRFCGCFFKPSFMQVVEPWLDTPINAISLPTLKDLYRALKRDSALDKDLAKSVGYVIVRELHRCLGVFDLEDFIYESAASMAEKEQALNKWLAYIPRDQGLKTQQLRINLNHKATSFSIPGF